ncbi:MAG: prolyl oligopeptidase family serine peptidase [Gemmataceae bacterium]
MHMRLIMTLLVAGSTVSPALAQERRPMKIQDLFRFQRVSDPQISPDGKWVACTVSEVSLKDNKSRSDIWMVSVDGQTRRRLTTTSSYSEWHPRWNPDSSSILFTSNRSGTTQLWLLSLKGGEATQLTTIATGADNGLWSHDGKKIAFVSTVYPEYSKLPYKKSNAMNKKRMDAKAKNPVKARVFTRLFFRHWDHYVEDKREHLFVMSSSGGEPKDVTPFDRDAFPTSFTFAIGDDFTFSPDSAYVVFTATPEKDEAWSTNYDICAVPTTGGKMQTLTKANKAADSAPRFSPDGKWMAYRAQKIPGSEADRWQLYIIPLGKGANVKRKSLTPDFDSSVEDFAWKDDRTLCFIAEKKARSNIYEVDIESATPKKIISGHTQRSLTISQNGKTMAFSRVAMTFPTEVFVTQFDGKAKNVTRANDAILSQLDLPQPESVTVKGDGGTPMQMWILKPPGFDPKKKWPLVYLVHGGPQGAWGDSWSYRWNPQIWAAQGYVVAAPNPRGSTGFGQKYVNEITGDWGGKVFKDLMKGMDYLEKLPYIDTKRMGSAGASYGGYMMNWFQGHSDRFNTLITHCGVYNFDSMWGTTEELWFDEWEHKGKPWEKTFTRKWSPHLYAKNFKTPMLIIHGDLDFRVPVSEGLQLFTTLQRLRIPSKMINFPDEGHWVSKPRNSEYWHREVFAWLKKYVPPGGK